MDIKWDANKYTNNFSFVHKYGNALIELIDKQDNMTCLDLGCGNGALTKQLNDLGISTMGLDASEDLLAIAKEHYPDITFLNGNATNFSLENTVNIVFSNAVLHWIAETHQIDLLKCVYNALADNGQFVFELGGKGNNALIHGALEQAFNKRGLTYKFPFYFPSVGEYSALMEAVGFKVTYATLFDRFTPLVGEDGLYDWIKMFIKSPFNGISEDVKEDITREVVDMLEPQLKVEDIWYSDYVRLRCKAVK